MKSKFYLISVMLFMAFTAGFSQWTNQNTGVSSIIWGIKAVDENTVWAGTGGGTVLRTTDGGQNWEKSVIFGAAAYTFFSVAAMDSLTAYFVGLRNPFKTRIYKTTDGAQSWELQFEMDTHISSIAFWDEANGIATGGTGEGNLMAFTTSNGGEDWTEVPAENIPLPLPGEFAGFADGGGTALAVAGSSHAWFGTAYGNNSNNPCRVFRTSDRGQTWTASETPLPTAGPYPGISSITFKDTLNGMVSGNYAPPFKTTDGGQNWTAIESFPFSGVGDASTILYVPETDFQVLFATGLGGPVYSGDDGDSWTRLGSTRFIGASFVNPTVSML